MCRADKSVANAKAFLQAWHKACPIRHRKSLTDNGKESTKGLLTCDGAAGKPHVFDVLCDQLGIEHRLTRPGTPRANDMAERFSEPWPTFSKQRVHYRHS